MPLDEYRRKRNFARSPEPRGDAPPARRPKRAAGGGYFCVHKHLSSHLHYDLRLEWHGVLLSWAVPKGPSLDSTDKRLAVRVEDHPLEYGSFEGVIPEGYGAGIVMLWDRGTWEPAVEDFDAALQRGDVKFTLDGYKLKGSWALVRTRGAYASRSGGDGRSWLLLKHRDFWSGPIDITTFAPKSVHSDADFDEILAADMPAVWASHRPARGGATGQLLQEVIERAAELRRARVPERPRKTPSRARADRRAPAVKSATRPVSSRRAGGATKSKGRGGRRR